MYATHSYVRWLQMTYLALDGRQNSKTKLTGHDTTSNSNRLVQASKEWFNAPVCSSNLVKSAEVFALTEWLLG
jgi:hypothetical protein